MQYSKSSAVIIKIIKIMSPQQKQKKLLDDAHNRIIKIRAMILEAQLQIMKMKAAALKARAQTLKNMALLSHIEC